MLFKVNIKISRLSTREFCTLVIIIALNQQSKPYFPSMVDYIHGYHPLQSALTINNKVFEFLLRTARTLQSDYREVFVFTHCLRCSHVGASSWRCTGWNYKNKKWNTEKCPCLLKVNCAQCSEQCACLIIEHSII